MIRQSEVTYGNGASDGHMDGFWFITDGSNNPTETSANIKSVTRVTGDIVDDFYRVRLCEPYPFHQGGVVGENWSVTQDEGLYLDADRLIGALVATVPAEEDMEIDIRVRQGVVYSNEVIAGNVVTGFVFFDARVY